MHPYIKKLRNSGLSVRAINVLQGLDVTSKQDIRKTWPHKLLGQYNCGFITVYEIGAFIGAKNNTLREMKRLYEADRRARLYKTSWLRSSR